MEFVAGHLFAIVAEPLSVLILLAFVGLLVSRRLVVLCVAAMLALLVLPVHQWAMLPLENRFPRPSAPEHVDGIIVLGGAIESFISAERGVPTLNAEANRMTEFVALARRYPAAQLVFSGGVGSIVDGSKPEADIARDFFESQGIPLDRLIVEGRSRTTYENAVDSKALAGPKPTDTWLLVTSANHMPRAVGSFRSVGWNVVPWPTSYQTRQALLPAMTKPFAVRMADLDVALHEWIGLVAYWLQGRSSALFPAMSGAAPR